MAAPRMEEYNAEGKTLRVESNHPYESQQWKFLWEFEEDEWIATQMLIDELNILNAPIQFRIVPNTD